MNAVTVEQLHKRYGSKVAVDDISFSVEPGEIFGILGPNGAGKTTTVECLEGLRVPDSGEIRVFGADPIRDRGRLHRILGAQLQESGLPDKLTVDEAIGLYASFYEDPADRGELMDALGLGPLGDVRFHKLSGGQKQRLSIALALIGRPRVAVLDELTTGLDPQARRDTWDLIRSIREQGVTILLVTHFMEEAERLCDRAAVLAAGRVRAIDSPAGLIARSGTEQQISFHPSRPVPNRLLRDLPQVTSVIDRQGDLVVAGTRDVLSAVTFTLARADIVAEDIHIQRIDLEDAFVAFTQPHPQDPARASARATRHEGST